MAKVGAWSTINVVFSVVEGGVAASGYIVDSFNGCSSNMGEWAGTFVDTTSIVTG